MNRDVVIFYNYVVTYVGVGEGSEGRSTPANTPMARS